MTESEARLLKSGFSPAELQKLKNNIASYGGSLNSVTRDLANRFTASKWITAVAAILLIVTLLLASGETSITLAITLAIVLPFIWYMTPATLAYKSCRYRRSAANSEQNP